MPAAIQHIVNATPAAGDGAAQAFDAGELPRHISQSIWRGTDLGQAGWGGGVQWFCDAGCRTAGRRLAL
ncbi:MAG: hypothetical protein IPG23_16265 [Burkholderiales bacterium]|nr:hypothetical protein [Burkholderiales bacterium]